MRQVTLMQENRYSRDTGNAVGNWAAACACIGCANGKDPTAHHGDYGRENNPTVDAV